MQSIEVSGINGVRCFDNPIWNTLVPAFKSDFPEAQFAVEEDTGVWPMEVVRMRKFIDRLHQQYDDGIDTLLVGHSMGGIFACALEKRFRHSRVCGVVTIFSPHSFLGGIFPFVLEAQHPLKAPIITFHATSDELVWWGSKHEQSLKHVRLPCDHFVQLSQRKELAEEISRTTKEVIF